MCRLFGAITQGPVYYDLFEEFADLAILGNTPSGGPDHRGHPDGWGLAFYRNGELVHHVRGAGAAPSEPRYYGAAWKIAKTNIDRKAGESLIVIAHLRRASGGMPVGTEWSHPFVGTKGNRRWAFAHNGSLKDFPSRKGENALDSESVFQTLLGHLDGSGPEEVADATRATISAIQEDVEYSSLNFLLTDGTALHAFREYRENGDYYTLYHDDLGEAVVVCSQPILQMRDNLLVKGYLLSVDSDLNIVKTRVV